MSKIQLSLTGNDAIQVLNHYFNRSKLPVTLLVEGTPNVLGIYEDGAHTGFSVVLVPNGLWHIRTEVELK